MICPVCGGASEVLETRLAGVGQVVRRRRLCGCCGHRFSTRETLVVPKVAPVVVAPVVVARVEPVAPVRPRRRRRGPSFAFNPFDDDDNFIPEG